MNIKDMARTCAELWQKTNYNFLLFAHYRRLSVISGGMDLMPIRWAKNKKRRTGRNNRKKNHGFTFTGCCCDCSLEGAPQVIAPERILLPEISKNNRRIFLPQFVWWMAGWLAEFFGRNEWWNYTAALFVLHSYSPFDNFFYQQNVSSTYGEHHHPHSTDKH